MVYCRIFLIAGPCMLLAGFLLFVVSCAILCSNLRCHDRPTQSAVKVLPIG